MRLEALLGRTAALHPERVAVDDGRVRRTFAELEDLVARQVAALNTLGLVPGERLAVLSRNRAEYVAPYFAAARLGAVLVPLNWRLTGAELAGILADAQPRLIVSEPDFESALGTASSVRFEVLEATTRFETKQQSPSEIAVQMYTSGTSGQPKGALLTHANCLAMTSAWLRDMPLEPQHRFLQVTPLFHVGGLLMLLSTIATGATLRLLPEFEPVAAIDVLANEGATHVLMVPAMVQWLLAEPYLEGKRFPKLQMLVYGAAPMPPATLRRATEVFGCDFLQGYGLTETCGVILTLTKEDHRLDPERLASAGRAVHGCEVRVVDERGRDVAPGASGEIGEIVARGPNLSPGYWQDEAATRDAWKDGWFHTGDLARIDTEGYITVVDRKKDMILVGGENVYPCEIEAVLREHPDIADACVIGIPHSVWGEEVLACVVPRPEAGLEARACIRHCRAHLARFKCPTRIEFFEQLPRNAAGKLLKRDLRAPYWRDQPRLV